MVEYGVAVDHAVSRQVDDLKLERVALRTHRSRWMAQPATLLASLRHSRAASQ